MAQARKQEVNQVSVHHIKGALSSSRTLDYLCSERRKYIRRVLCTSRTLYNVFTQDYLYDRIQGCFMHYQKMITCVIFMLII